MRLATTTCLLASALTALALALAGCNGGNPPTGSTAYKEGKLGNGSFLFKCDDSVACDRWSTDSAKDFPTEVATGSNFNLRFVADGKEGSTLTISGRTYDGITLEAVGPYVSRGTNDFAAISPGYGTVIARDASGRIIDYVQITIVKPDGLVVYKADYKGLTPPRLQAINMKKSESQSFRTVAEFKQEAIAGSVAIEWTSADSNVVQVESYNDAVVTIVAKNVGKTKLTAAGRALTKELEVEVTE